MAERASALSANYPRGRLGPADMDSGASLSEVRNLSLLQIAAWPDTLAEVGAGLAAQLGISAPPGACEAAFTERGSLLRVEPLKWWLIDGDIAAVAAAFADAGRAVTLDQSQSRTRVRIGGPRAAELLNRHLPLDLREASFPVGRLANTGFHHAGVTLWRHEQGYDLLLPRGFALSLWELLMAAGEQFGAEVV